MAVICQYCHRMAVLTTGAEVYSDRPDLANRKIWKCDPCQAWVGCQDDTDIPLGSLADGKLRSARIAAHAAFDPLWKAMRHLNGISEIGAREIAYGWLAEQFRIPREECRFASMDYEQCLRATVLCRELQAELDQERGNLPLLGS